MRREKGGNKENKIKESQKGDRKESKKGKEEQQREDALSLAPQDGERCIAEGKWHLWGQPGLWGAADTGAEPPLARHSSARLGSARPYPGPGSPRPCAPSGR